MGGSPPQTPEDSGQDNVSQGCFSGAPADDRTRHGLLPVSCQSVRVLHPLDSPVGFLYA